MLVILDGWGIGLIPEADAIAQAQTPFYDQLLLEHPHSKLISFGPSVGLPEGQFGNSEVGHIHLGAGRVVWQDLGRISRSIEDQSILQNKTILELVDYCLGQRKDLHLIGLLSDGGVHSHIDHLYGMLEALERLGLKKIFIHAILDGRDTDPRAGIKYVKELQHFLESKNSTLVSLIGRYYAMDRDKRWERSKLAFDLYTKGIGNLSDDLLASLQKSYQDGITDEFVKPIILKSSFDHLEYIKDRDAVFCLNFRTDRLRQLTTALTQTSLPDYNTHPLDLYYVTMTPYDERYKNVRVVFEKENIRETLGEMISRFGGKQLRIAETEKYPHVSYFLSGGREQAFAGERRILVPSPKVATYDLQPQMSAEEVTDALLQDMLTNPTEFVCINYANTDMVGHTGVFKAVVGAAETVDRCLRRLIPQAVSLGYQILILADHGNGELMLNPDGSPHTAHTSNFVPCILICDRKDIQLKDGKLSDIAPTILELMNLPVPSAMTGESLLTKNGA